MKNNELKCFAAMDRVERSALKLANRFRNTIQVYENGQWVPAARPLIWDYSKAYRVAK